MILNFKTHNSNEQHYSDDLLESYHIRLKDILKNDFNNWLNLKSNQVQLSENKEPIKQV